MTGRHPDLELLTRDLRAFLKWSGIKPTPFSTANGFRSGLAKDVLNGGSVSFETHGRIYEIMAEAGFESVRWHCDVLFLAALVGEPADILAASDAMKACHASQAS